MFAEWLQRKMMYKLSEKWTFAYQYVDYILGKTMKIFPICQYRQNTSWSNKRPNLKVHLSEPHDLEQMVLPMCRKFSLRAIKGYEDYWKGDNEEKTCYDHFKMTLSSFFREIGGFKSLLTIVVD